MSQVHPQRHQTNLHYNRVKHVFLGFFLHYTRIFALLSYLFELAIIMTFLLIFFFLLIPLSILKASAIIYHQK